MHQIRFRLGFRPRPRWGSNSAAIDPQSWILGGPISKGKGVEGKEGKKRGEVGERDAGDGKVREE